MGSICGADSLESRQSATAGSAPTSRKDNANAAKAVPAAPFKWVGDKHAFKFTFFIQTPPIVRGNEVIFLYTKKQRTKYVIFDLNECKVTKKALVKCNDDNFDVFNTVYALHEQQQTIYFIANNDRIFTLDLNDADNELKSLDKSVVTSDDNVASIAYINDKLYILGGEEKSDPDDNYELVPYSKAVKYVSADLTRPRIDGFGQFATVIKVNKDNSDWIYVMGGLHMTEKGYLGPNDQLFRYVLTNCEEYDDDPQAVNRQRWQSSSYFVQPANRFGLINYNNEYLISFGGCMFMNKKVEKKLASIFVLALKDTARLSKDTWYELVRTLPQPGHYHAVYQPGGEVVHLFSYLSEKDHYQKFYYQLNVQELIKELVDYDAIKNRMDENGNAVPVNAEHGAVEKHGWHVRGKPLLPEKTLSIINLGPKDDEDTDDD